MMKNLQKMVQRFLAIKKNIIPLIQKCLNEDQLDKFAFITETKDLKSNNWVHLFSFLFYM